MRYRAAGARRSSSDDWSAETPWVSIAAKSCIGCRWRGGGVVLNASHPFLPPTFGREAVSVDVICNMCASVGFTGRFGFKCPTIVGVFVLLRGARLTLRLGRFVVGGE